MPYFHRIGGIRWDEWREAKASLECFIAPRKGLKNSEARGFNPELYTQFVSVNKASLDGVNEYRLEAYPTLLSGGSSDLSRTSWRYLLEPTATAQRRKVAEASSLYFVRTGERYFSRQSIVALGELAEHLGGEQGSGLAGIVRKSHEFGSAELVCEHRSGVQRNSSEHTNKRHGTR